MSATWKDSTLPWLKAAIGHEDFSLERGVLTGANLPPEADLRARVHALQKEDLERRIAARKAQLAKRGPIIRAHFKRQFRMADVVLVQGMQRFGGLLPAEITVKDKELLLWGHWMRDMKRAIDQSRDVPRCLPFPPLPSWFKSNPGVDRLCRDLGIGVQG